MPAASEPTVRPLTRGMRVLLVVAGLLVVLAGVQLSVFPTQTEERFAWTIAVPMTAVFLGAAYWAAAAVEWTAATRRSWAEARVAVPGVLLFTALTFVVTLVHLDLFHLGPEHPIATRAVTWTWLAVYAVVPVLMAGLWLRQLRLPGGDPPRRRPLRPAVRVALAVQAAVLVPFGLALLVAPGPTAALWPWPLTALTGRALGAWLLSLGVVAGHAIREADAERIKPAVAGSLAFAGLQAVALVRHGDALTSGGPAVLFGILLGTFLLVGAGSLLPERAPAGAGH